MEKLKKSQQQNVQLIFSFQAQIYHPRVFSYSCFHQNWTTSVSEQEPFSVASVVGEMLSCDPSFRCRCWDHGGLGGSSVAPAHADRSAHYWCGLHRPESGCSSAFPSDDLRQPMGGFEWSGCRCQRSAGSEVSLSPNFLVVAPHHHQHHRGLHQSTKNGCLSPLCCCSFSANPGHRDYRLTNWACYQIVSSPFCHLHFLELLVWNELS